MQTRLTADAVIIGAGVNGLSAAFHLARLGVRKVIVADRAYPAAGASSRGMGLLRTYHVNEPEAALAIKSLDIFQHWKEIVGGSCGFEQTGFLWLDHARNRSKVEHAVAMLTRLGARSEILYEKALLDLQPHFAVEETIAVYEPGCGCAYGALASDALCAAMRRLGVDLMTRTPVLELEATGGRMSGVVTSQGTISTDTVLLAAGAWTAPLARTVGVSLPICPRRLSIGRIHLTAPLRAPMTFLDGMFDTSFRPEGDQAAIISMRDTRYGAAIDPDDLCDDVEVTAIVAGIDRLAKRIPSVAQATGGRTWTGVDGFTPDYKGIYGRIKDLPGLYVCAGASEKGFKVSPAVGMGLAELIVEGHCDYIEHPAFSPERFTSAAATHGTNTVHVDELL